VRNASHYTSKTSTTSQFLAAVDPGAVVISVGTGDHFGHPSPESLEKLNGRPGENNIYRTDEDSTIEFITDREWSWVKTEKI
jgi:competence protein ComEC